MSQTIAKHITTPPVFIASKRCGRGANCPNVTRKSYLSVEFLLNFGNSLSWMTQVHDEKVVHDKSQPAQQDGIRLSV